MERLFSGNILKFDALAGLLNGIFVLGLQNQIIDLYGLPRTLVLFVGAVNLTYALVGFLNLRYARRKKIFLLLVYGNFTWALCCLLFAISTFGSSIFYATVHGFIEGFFVGILALYEWRNHDKIVAVNKFI